MRLGSAPDVTEVFVVLEFPRICKNFLEYVRIC